jgi:hypothetical protein
MLILSNEQLSMQIRVESISSKAMAHLIKGHVGQGIFVLMSVNWDDRHAQNI